MPAAPSYAPLPSLYASPAPAPIRAEPRETTPRKPMEELRTTAAASSQDYTPPYEGHSFPSTEEKASRRQRNMLRFAIPAALLLLLAFGFLQLSRFLKANSLTQPAKPAPTQPAKPPGKPTATPAVTPVSPPQVGSVKPPEPPASLPPVTVPPATTTTPVIQPPPPAVEPAAVELPPQAGAIARRMVEQFLAATTFDERMMYVLTKKTPSELQNSFLSRKWPTAQITPGAQIPHPAERLTEFYFEVRFGENSVGFPRETTILVHQRGDEEPKIILEPLLDTVGGRLRDFAKEPSSKPQDFYVIMDARVRCFDDKIPNADKKCTFFLRAHISGMDIATAYATEISQIRKQFDDPLAGFKWKKPMPVVVTLQWNTTEDYTRPFIEVIDIKAKNWNP